MERVERAMQRLLVALVAKMEKAKHETVRTPYGDAL
jgi:hypothetical protein